jgi:hypothetical protein
MKEAFKNEEFENVLSGNEDGAEQNMNQYTAGKNQWYNKLFTYTKEFFETTPDSDF